MYDDYEGFGGEDAYLDTWMEDRMSGGDVCGWDDHYDDLWETWADYESRQPDDPYDYL